MRRPSAFAISQRFCSAQTNVSFFTGRFKAMANWMLSTGIDYRFCLSSITLLESEIPISERLFWTSLSEILIFGSSFKCLWIFELILGLHSVSGAIFDIVKPPSHLLVFSLTKGGSLFNKDRVLYITMNSENIDLRGAESGRP